MLKLKELLRVLTRDVGPKREMAKSMDEALESAKQRNKGAVESLIGEVLDAVEKNRHARQSSENPDS